MNRVLLIGRLVRSPEVRYSGDLSIARFTIAVDRNYKTKDGNKETDFIQCVAFDKRATFIEKYIDKGSKVGIEGRWQTGAYENKEGKKVYTNDCVVDAIEFAESKKAQQDANDFTPTDADEEHLPFV